MIKYLNISKTICGYRDMPLFNAVKNFDNHVKEMSENRGTKTNSWDDVYTITEEFWNDEETKIVEIKQYYYNAETEEIYNL